MLHEATRMIAHRGKLCTITGGPEKASPGVRTHRTGLWAVD